MDKQGLYNPANEHDACGVGFVAHIKGKKSHSIVEQGLLILKNLDHRGAVGADKLMGDGAGILGAPSIFFCGCAGHDVLNLNEGLIISLNALFWGWDGGM